MMVAERLCTKHMDIVEVAKHSGMPASKLRYYEENGLIASVGRLSLRRTFDAGVLDQLKLVSLGQAAGFSLDEIAQMFPADGRTRGDKKTLATNANKVDTLVNGLRGMSKRLRLAADGVGGQES